MATSPLRSGRAALASHGRARAGNARLDIAGGTRVATPTAGVVQARQISAQGPPSPIKGFHSPYSAVHFPPFLRRPPASCPFLLAPCDRAAANGASAVGPMAASLV